ncbi:MAG: glutathione S-transferase family protein [Burkholderiaceae bacterium]
MPIEQIAVNTSRPHREPEHLARNPFGTLPVLELDDGSHLIESLAIINYLEDRFNDGAPAAAGAGLRPWWPTWSAR